MFTVFVLGNIASGKSTACRYLESHFLQRYHLPSYSDVHRSLDSLMYSMDYYLLKRDTALDLF